MLSFHFTTIHYCWHHPLLLLIILVSSVAQNISINDSLTATETSTPWRSPNGDFAFGFQQLQANKDLFVLSIWFTRIPDQTILWHERSSYPVRRGSTLRLEATHGLVLRDPQGSPLYNTSNDDATSFGNQVAFGFMKDNGNFVLTAANTSDVLWESFRHPTDTILPTQTIEIGQVLISRKTESDLSQGRFRAIMNATGDFVFNFKTVPSSEDFDYLYYTSQTSNETASDSGFRVQFDEAASISVVTRDGRTLTSLTNPSRRGSQNYYRATLDFDGVFMLYYLPKVFDGNPRWMAAQGQPNDPRDVCAITAYPGSGPCGFNNMCIVRNARPVCECPQGFSLVDPSNTHGDCKSDFVQNCVEAEGQECSLTEIPGVNWPMYDYERLPGSTEQECKDACLRDYSCTVAVKGRSACWKKTLPLSNGRNDQSTITYFKRGKPIHQNSSLPKPKRERDRKLLILVGSLILGSSVFINLLFTTAACFGFFPTRNKTKLLNLVRDTATTAGTNLRCFTYKQLVQATDAFKEELGRGGFGIVYKGVIVMPDNSRTTVAVKKLDRLGQDSDKEFRTEVEAIGQIHHRNVVRMVGFCDEGPNRLLVYEYMTNGTLAGFLFGHPKPGWRQRTQLAIGVARGLAYLHEECSTQIIHCDIKPQNILLDQDYTARISDFGLAKLLMLNQSRTVTNIRGTRGYVSPEWFRNTQITTKVDVYSFGVVLLEIISCRKAVVDGGNPILSEWAWECFVEGRVDGLVEYEEEAISDGVLLERFVKVGLWCIQEDAGLRPSMRITCQMLEGTMDVALPPWPSSFSLVSTHPYSIS